MSGHSGFQAIGNHLPPPNFEPQLNGVQAPNEAPGQPSAVSGGDAPVQGQEAPKSTAQELAQKLDSMLLQAATLSTRVVTNQSVAEAADAAKLGKAERKALAAAIKDARQTMAAILNFSGQEIANALVTGEDGVFDWDAKNLAADAIRMAIDAQAKLSELLTDLANRPEITGDAFEEFSELALQCDRRRSEISTLAMQLADAAAKKGTNPEIAKLLDTKLMALLPRKALSMHGNTEILDKMKAQLQPLADRLEAFAARPNASINSTEFMAYTIEVKDATAAIYRAISEGFPTPDGGRMMPDRDFMTSLAALAKVAEKKLSDVRTNIGNAVLKDFVNRVIGLPEKYPIFEEENLDDLSRCASNMANLVEARLQLRKACLAYIKNPSQEKLTKINNLLFNYSTLSTNGVDNEIDYLESHLKGDMTKADWKNVRAIFSAKPSSLKTQVAHLVSMVRNVRSRMTPEQFLSTDSARALLEGKFSFPSLVEARVHGMSDADVDPALDDSRLVSSKPLGSGQVNTVNLVTYQDGAQYVFKPEAPGRQMMENLTLTKDYTATQQVAQLNLATQSVANSLGLNDVVPKCSVGAHNGDYGLFMEKVPGQDAVDFAKGKAPAPRCLTAQQVRDLKPEQYGKVIGNILRGLNRLEWLDLITGQGDRHAHNYLIEIHEDLSVSIKGIDNDQSFPAYRTGLRTYVLKGNNASHFRSEIENAIKSYPSEHRKAVRTRIENDPGYVTNPDGSVTIDTTKFKAGELFFIAQASIGMHGCNIPDYIDEDLYAQLMNLKEGNQRDALLADLASRLSPAALDSAVKRLDEAIAQAEKLKTAGKVIRNEDFAKRDIQNFILGDELHKPSNPVEPVDGYSLSPSTKLVRKASRQIHSFFVRDLFKSVAKKDWFV